MVNAAVNNNEPYGCFRNILKPEKPIITIIIINLYCL
jgi:hypothetical protein